MWLQTPVSWSSVFSRCSCTNRLWNTAEVDQSQVFLCFCPRDPGHWFWSWFSCSPHAGGKVTFLRSILLDNDPHRWLAASTRSLPPAEKSLNSWAQCLTKHKISSLSLLLLIYVSFSIWFPIFTEFEGCKLSLIPFKLNVGWNWLLGSIASMGTFTCTHKLWS